MTARRFTLSIEGLERPLHGLLFDSPAEADRLQALTAENGSTARPFPAAASTSTDEPRGVGRPSHDKLLGAAVAAFDLNPQHSIAEQARQLMAHLEQAELDPLEDVPSQRCIEEFLKNLPKNSGRAKRRARRT